MKTLSTIAAATLALTMVAGTAEAQSRRYDNDRDDAGRNAILGAVVGGIAGAAVGNGDSSYVLGGALAGAALGAAASNDNDNRRYGYDYRYQNCDYYRDGRCWRNRGHWEREHGINSRDPRWEQRRDYRRHQRDERRDYRYDRRW